MIEVAAAPSPPVLPPAIYLAGAFGGICVLVFALSLLIGQAYRERMLWWHAGTLAVGLLVEAFHDFNPMLSATLWTLQLAMAALTLRATVGGRGSTRRPGIALSLLCPAFGLAAALGWSRAPQSAWLLLPWGLAVGWFVYRAWGQARPWIWWIAAGQLALGVHGLVSLGVLPPASVRAPGVESMAALAVFAIATYVGLVWFSRLRSENALRVEAHERTDPLTGLATPRVFFDRVDGALVRSRNLHYSVALLVVRVANLERIVADEQLESTESAILAASRAIGYSLRAQDSAARLGNNRFAVMAEGIKDNASHSIGTRIVAQGLRAAHFGIIQSEVNFQVAFVEIAIPRKPARAILLELDEALTHMTAEHSGPLIRSLPKMV